MKLNQFVNNFNNDKSDDSNSYKRIIAQGPDHLKKELKEFIKQNLNNKNEKRSVGDNAYQIIMVIISLFIKLNKIIISNNNNNNNNRKHKQEIQYME